MKLTLSFLILLFFSTQSFAEHDATYCGRLVVGNEYSKLWRTSVDLPTFILEVDYQVLIDFDEYAPAVGTAAIYLDKTDSNYIKMSEAVARSRKTTKFCVSASWGGSIYDNSAITDSVHRFGYASQFGDEN